jgi:hypothetical protein
MTESVTAGGSPQTPTPSAPSTIKKGRILGWIIARSGFERALLLYLVAWPPILVLFLLWMHGPVKEAVMLSILSAAPATLLLAVIGAKILDYLTSETTPITPEAQAYLDFLARQQEDERREKHKRPPDLDGLKLVASGVLVAGALVVVAVYVWQEFGESASKTAQSVATAIVRPFDEYTCKNNLQSDLEEFWGPAKDPTVTKCSGRPEKAICLVKSLHNGIYKTVPFVSNCSKRYFEAGLQAKANASDKERKRWEAQLEEFMQGFQVAE